MVQVTVVDKDGVVYDIAYWNNYVRALRWISVVRKVNDAYGMTYKITNS